MRSAIVRGTHLIAKSSSQSRCRDIGTASKLCVCSLGKADGTRQISAVSGLPRLVSRLIHRNAGAKKTSSRTYAGGAGGGGIGAGSGGGGGGGGEGSSGGGGGLWQAYMRLLETNPILTKSVSAAVLNALGDILSQVYFEKNGKLDFTRIFQFAFLGLVFVGPSLHYWYGGLATKVPFTGTKGLFVRLAVDQGAFAPVFIAAFFSLLLVLEGKPNMIENKLKQDWKSAVLANWQLWIPIQLINFGLVPVNLQVLFANTIAIGWNTYMSYKSHKYVPPVVVAE